MNIELIELIDHFIFKFERISSAYWTVGMYKKGRPDFEQDRGIYCALGHCGAGRVSTTIEAVKLVDLFAKFSLSVAEVNDGTGIGYKYGRYPKERILNALNAMREATLAGRDKI